MVFRQKNESLASKSKLLSKRQLALVLTVNESGSSFRFTIPKFNLDLHLPSTYNKKLIESAVDFCYTLSYVYCI